jgi:phosphatidylglycerophosphatase A
MSAKNRLALCIATWFGCGYSPIAPGTAGSLGAIAVALVIDHFWHWPPIAYLIPTMILLAPGIWAADVTERWTNQKDPQLVVVDEVIGQWITLAGATTLNWKSWVIALVLFRLFDIWKPPPVRQLERLPGGLGIVADDAMAGVYGALVIFILGLVKLY